LKGESTWNSEETDLKALVGVIETYGFALDVGGKVIA